MTEIDHILSDTRHRPFNIPTGKWTYYQEWNNALFLHWKVSYELLRRIVPQGLNLDTFDNNVYVSLVAFTMQNIRPRNLPALKFISDFEEINLRTYVDNGNKKGVYFLSIEAEKQLSVLVARALSGLPYEKSDIHRTSNSYASNNQRRNFRLNAEFDVGQRSAIKTELDKWLTERYCLYLDDDRQIYRYDIHHREWPIRDVKVKRLDLSYRIGEIDLTNHQPDLVHYSNGVKVIAWGRTTVLGAT